MAGRQRVDCYPIAFPLPIHSCTLSYFVMLEAGSFCFAHQSSCWGLTTGGVRGSDFEAGGARGVSPLPVPMSIMPINPHHPGSSPWAWFSSGCPSEVCFPGPPGPSAQLLGLIVPVPYRPSAEGWVCSLNRGLPDTLELSFLPFQFFNAWFIILYMKSLLLKQRVVSVS